jgi:hypothetical protein
MKHLSIKLIELDCDAILVNSSSINFIKKIDLSGVCEMSACPNWLVYILILNKDLSQYIYSSCFVYNLIIIIVFSIIDEWSNYV